MLLAVHFFAIDNHYIIFLLYCG